MKKILSILFFCLFMCFSNAGNSSYKSSTSGKSYSYSKSNYSKNYKSSNKLFTSTTRNNYNNNYKKENKSLFVNTTKSNYNSNNINPITPPKPSLEKRIFQDFSNFENKENNKPSSNKLFSSTNKDNYQQKTDNSDRLVNSNNYNSYSSGKNYYLLTDNLNYNTNKFAQNQNLRYNYGYNTSAQPSNTIINNYNGGNGNDLTNTLINYMLISNLTSSFNQKQYVNSQEQNNKNIIYDNNDGINKINSNNETINPNKNSSEIFPWFEICLVVISAVIIVLIILLAI